MQRFTLILISLILPATLLTSVPVGAVKASDWNAGNIINDKIFTDKKAMTVTEIRLWLNAHVGSCDYYGKKASELGGGIDYNGNGVVSRAEYGKTKGNPAPFTCLNKYYEVPKTSPGPGVPASNYGKSTIPTGAKSAARLIYDAAQAYNISPKVLLVKLGTESAGPLTSDTWPFKRQYTYAMGAHCPDSGPGGSANCDSDYAGFSLQMREAAKLLRWYLDSMTQSWWSYKKPYASNYIQWTVASSCGGKNVYIANKATAALYTYTPYQPNSASLNSYPGTGNSCSSYGNRNFWYVFSNWFGSTQSKIEFKRMSTPRWMQLNTATQKIDPFTKEALNNSLTDGQQVFFRDKITIGGTVYLRTEHDSKLWLDRVVPISKLDEVDISYGSLKYPRWMQTTENLYKINPRTKQKTKTLIRAGTLLYFPTKTSVGGSTYLRSQADTTNNVSAVIPLSSAATGAPPEYVGFGYPRWMIATKDTKTYDLRYPGIPAPSIAAGSRIYFDYKTNINGNLYVSQGQPGVDTYTGTPYAHLRNIDDSDFRSMKNQRAYELLNDVNKYDVSMNTSLPSTFTAGTQIYFQTRFTLNGTVYLRSARDGVNKTPAAIPIDELSPVDVTFDDMVAPRRMNVAMNVKKLDPVTLTKLDTTIRAGSSVSFSQKIRIDDTLYLRSTFDAERGHYKVIPYASLEEL